jgi:hypothetical protein
MATLERRARRATRRWGLCAAAWVCAACSDGEKSAGGQSGTDGNVIYACPAGIVPVLPDEVPQNFERTPNEIAASIAGLIELWGTWLTTGSRTGMSIAVAPQVVDAGTSVCGSELDVGINLALRTEDGALDGTWPGRIIVSPGIKTLRVDVSLPQLGANYQGPTVWDPDHRDTNWSIFGFAPGRSTSPVFEVLLGNGERTRLAAVFLEGRALGFWSDAPQALPPFP